MSKIIFVTGAGRGLGTDIAREALAAGHQVVAAGRRPEEVEKVLGGPQDDLLATRLDVTSLDDAQAAAQAAVDRFGRIDVLINNAGNFFAGFFEEIPPAHMRQQIETNLLGPMNVTRAILPVMRRQRAGHIITISYSPVWSARSSTLRTPPPSSASRAGWNPSATTSPLQHPDHHRRTRLFPHRAARRRFHHLA